MLAFKFLFFVIGSLCIQQSVQEPVKLTLFYEGLCPYCDEFITNQLYQGYQTLGDDYLLLDLVPYGNAQYQKYANGTVDFICQHGPTECLINKIHACVINGKSTQAQLVGFVHCHINKMTADPLKIAQGCANDNGLSFEDINSCVSSPESDKFLIAYAERQAALNPPLPYVPNIWFNDVYDEVWELRARYDLVYAVCIYLQDPKPEVCNSSVKGHPKRLFTAKHSNM